MKDHLGRRVRFNKPMHLSKQWERYYAFDMEWSTFSKEVNILMNRAFQYYNDRRVDKVLLGVNNAKIF